MFVLMIIWISFIACDGVSMTWIPNTEGLFSQFLQLHIMMYIKEDLNLSAVVVPAFNTIHAEDADVNICKVFHLPGFVQCKSVQRLKGSKCRENSITLRRYYYHNNEQRNNAVVLQNVTEICYNMISPFLGGQTRRDAFLRVVCFITRI